MKHKYHARAVYYDGIRFASMKEGNRYLELKLLLRAGKISDLKLQVEFLLVPSYKTPDGKTRRKRIYIADFTYYDTKTKEFIVEDVKGCRKGMAYQQFSLKRDIIWEKYGIFIKET